MFIFPLLVLHLSQMNPVHILKSSGHKMCFKYLQTVCVQLSQIISSTLSRLKHCIPLSSVLHVLHAMALSLTEHPNNV
jgi:hypothetical protein